MPFSDFIANSRQLSRSMASDLAGDLAEPEQAMKRHTTVTVTNGHLAGRVEYPDEFR